MRIAKSRSAVLLAVALIFAACTHAVAPPPPVVPLRGGTLDVRFASDVDSLDPNRAASPASWFIARALHRGLLAFPDRPFPGGARPVPDLAAAMPVIRGVLITFRLRGDVRFGAPVSRPVNAADVVASVARVRASHVGMAAALNDLVGVHATGARTVVFTLARPRNDFLEILAQPQMAIVPLETPLPGLVAPTSIVGLGPYRISSYHPERSLFLERNPAWSGDDVRPAYVDTISATFGDAALGGSDVVADPGPPDVLVPAVPSGANTIATSDGCVRYLFMDPRARPFSSVYARRAVAQAVVRAGLPGSGVVPATGVLPPTVFGTGSAGALEENTFTASLDLSRAKLARGFAPTMIVEDSARDRAQAIAIARSLSRVGIRLRIVIEPPPDLVALYADPARIVPMGLATWCADWPGNAGWDVLRGITARAPSFAPVIATALAAGNPLVAWAAADRMLCAQGFVVPLLWTASTTAVSARLRGFTGSPMWPRGDPTGLWLRP